jgi:hypothetical protein
MFNRFSNEPTSVVFETLANDPDAYECIEQVVKRDPRSAVDEIRTFTEKRTINKLAPDSANRRLTEATLRMVRWVEIRDAIARA